MNPNHGEFWNPKNETMPRDELDQLKLIKLRLLGEWAYERSPFHRRQFDAAGFRPEALKTLDDLRRMPFMTREAWMASQAERPLFGDLLAVPERAAVRYHLTSGTTGRTPLRVLDSLRDWSWISECWAYGFHAMGVRAEDVVFFAFSYGSFIGFWGAHYACEKMGALVIPSGNMTTENRVKQIVEMGATVVCSTPTYAFRMAEVARELGIDLARQSKVKVLILSGEPSGSIAQSRRLLQQAWGADAGDTAGMTEIGTIMTFECRHHPGGTHILEDHFIEEVLEPGGDRACGYGEKGERVVTSFGRAFMPLIRYRTSDMVEKVPYSECRCGRTFDIYRGGIQGRWDDMRKIRGTNVYPAAVEAVVRERPEIEEFQIVFRRDPGGVREDVVVRVELKAGAGAAWGELEGWLDRELATAHEGLKFQVERAEEGSLPRFELKARRVVDQRGERT